MKEDILERAYDFLEAVVKLPAVGATQDTEGAPRSMLKTPAERQSWIKYSRERRRL
jgi:hypothetical protein